ncbi:hypothetical protein [Pelobium manganitolerans]|uniref:hypothetical protein n=1 Tax=Pelobium manganitolerans TaxID=1842495 RepID=UPI003FA374D8
MKKLIFLLTIGTSLTFVACNNQQKTDEQIDSINQSAADSLLNEALADTTATDNVAVDSTVVDTLAPKK